MDSPRIAVVGGGWYGCQLASSLLSMGCDVVLFEKAPRLFSGASGKNQFRLHAGLHYPRSSVTRNEITKGLREFKIRMPQFVRQLDTCLYAISSSGSSIDYGAYKQVFDATGIQYEEVPPSTYGLTNVEGCLDTKEEFFIFVNAPRDYYEKKLGSIMRLNHCVEEIRNEKVDEIDVAVVDGIHFDWCINCTYNQSLPMKSPKCCYEVCLSLIYKERVQLPSLVGITIMDGDFCSLYPYILDEKDFSDGPRRYTLTHVKHTPLLKTISSTEAQAFMDSITEDEILPHKPNFEAGIATFYPAFIHQFEYDGWFVSMKTKPLDAGASNHTASRECIVERDGRCLNVLSGKINTLFEAERVVLSEVLKQWSSAFNPETHELKSARE